MDRLHYAGGTVLTGSAIARALLDYASALAEVRESATVRIPTMMPDGSIGHSTLLIGPASQLISDEEPGDRGEIEDDALVAHLSAETRKLRPRAIATELDAEDDRISEEL